MIKDAATYADENTKMRARVQAENAFDGYLRAMKSATEGSGSRLSSRKGSGEAQGGRTPHPQSVQRVLTTGWSVATTRLVSSLPASR